MPSKKSKSGRDYEIDGRKMIWHADVDEDETPFDVTLPLRLKLKALRPFADATSDDVAAMFDMVAAVIPGQTEQLDEMDLNDFEDMFSTWQDEYKNLNGASLGEASSSSS